MEPLGVENIPVNVENLDYPTVDKMVVQREDIHLLERQVYNISFHGSKIVAQFEDYLERGLKYTIPYFCSTEYT